MIRSNVAVFISAVVAITASARPVHAQYSNSSGTQDGASGNIDGFAVAGKGTVSAKPNRLEIELEVSAASELTADAIVSCTPLGAAVRAICLCGSPRWMLGAT